MLSYESFINLSRDTFIHITSFVGANKIFLRQVCKYFSETLPEESIYGWSKLILEEKSLGLLQLAINQGYKINKKFVIRCLTEGCLPILEYVSTIIDLGEISRYPICDTSTARWILSHGYDKKKISLARSKTSIKIRGIL